MSNKKNIPRANLIPIIRDLETILLRRLVVELKNTPEHSYPGQAIGQYINTAREYWGEWPELIKRENPPMFATKVRGYLISYLKKQLQSQLAELILLKPRYLPELSVYLDAVHADPQTKTNLQKLLTDQHFRSRYFSPYLPEMHSMMEYTLKHLSSEHGSDRDVMEAINQKFFSELVKLPQLLYQLGLVEGQILIEISPPILEHKESEMFIRTWELVEKPSKNKLPRYFWQVTNYALPYWDGYLDSVDNYFQIRTDELLGLQPISEGLSHQDLSTLFLIGPDQLDSFLMELQQDQQLTSSELRLMSEFIVDLLDIDIVQITNFLYRIIDSLTLELEASTLRRWEQMLSLLLLKYCPVNYAEAKIEHKIDLTTSQNSYIHSPDLLIDLAGKGVNHHLRQLDFPQWIFFDDIQPPQPAKIKVEDIHSMFDTSKNTREISSAKISMQIVDEKIKELIQT